MSNLDRVVERVRKMLALANDAGASEGERDNAMRMAHATLAKHNLSMSEVDKKKDDRGHIVGQYYGRPWARALSSIIADLFFCRYVFIPASKAKDVRHMFIGRESNAVTAQMMAQYLVDSIHREGRRRQRQAGQNNNWFRVFCLAAVQAVNRKADALKQKPDLAEATPGTALVLADLYQTEQQLNDQWLSEQMKVKKAPPTRPKVDYDETAASAGRQYGSSLSLNQQLSGGSK